MSMHALILNGVVIQVEPEPFEVAEPLTWIETGDDVQPGWQVVDGVPVAPEPPPPVVPASITPLQARRALRAAGLKEAADAHIATLPEEEQEAWEYATIVERTHPAILSAAAALGMTGEQLDELFLLGSTL
jgi:hypothetical protein